MSTIKLNLGCGQNYRPGWVNVDVIRRVKADQYFDLEVFPWPLPDNSADYVLMDNVLEHLWDVRRTMEELWRITAPGGRVEIIVPYFKSDWAHMDTTHRHCFTEESMDLYCTKRTGHWYADDSKRFVLLEARLRADRRSLRHKLRNAIPFRRLLRWMLWNMYDGINFTLLKPKSTNLMSNPETICATKTTELHWHPLMQPVVEWFNALKPEQQNVVRPDVQAMNGALRMLEAPDF